jgi:hypothetical protein
MNSKTITWRKSGKAKIIQAALNNAPAKRMDEAVEISGRGPGFS